MSDECVIIFVAMAGAHNVGPTPRFGQFLAAYDPDYQPPGYPGWQVGGYEWTDDPARAMRFVDRTAAYACWTQQSKVVPLRPDGQPNRPLTAVTISVEAAP